MAFAQKLAYLYPRLSEHIGELKNPQEACLHVYIYIYGLRFHSCDTQTSI